MGKMNLSICIDAEPPAVFDVIADIENSPDRIEWYEKVEMLTDGPVDVGTRWRETRVMNNRKSLEEWELTAIERPNYLSAYCDSCGYDVNYTMRVDPDGDGSTLTLSMTTRPRTIVGKLMTPVEWLMAGMLKRIVLRDLENTKAYIERQNSPT